MFYHVLSLFSRLCLDLRKCHVCTFCWKLQWPERSSVPCKVENEKWNRGTPSIYYMMVGQELQKGKPMRPHTGTNNECIAYKYPYYLSFPMLENRRLTDCVRVSHTDCGYWRALAELQDNCGILAHVWHTVCKNVGGIKRVSGKVLIFWQQVTPVVGHVK